MNLTHKECGGEVVVDYDRTPYRDKEDHETYYPVKCTKCGQPLGLLAEVEDKCQVH